MLWICHGWSAQDLGWKIDPFQIQRRGVNQAWEKEYHHMLLTTVAWVGWDLYSFFILLMFFKNVFYYLFSHGSKFKRSWNLYSGKPLPSVHSHPHSSPGTTHGHQFSEEPSEKRFSEKPEVFYRQTSKCTCIISLLYANGKLALHTVKPLALFFHLIIYFGDYLMSVYIRLTSFFLWLHSILFYKLIYLTSPFKSFQSSILKIMLEWITCGKVYL